MFVVGNRVLMVIANVPETLPLKFPFSENVPFSEYWSAWYESKQGPGSVNVKLVTVREPLVPGLKVVEKV